MAQIGSISSPSVTLRAPAGRVGYLATFAVTTVLIAGVTWWLIERERQSTLAYWEVRQESIAEVMASRVADWARERQADAEALADVPSIYAVLSADSELPAAAPSLLRQRLVRYLEQMRAVHLYRGVYVLDLAGNVVVQAPNSPPLAAEVTAAAQTTAREGKPHTDLLGDIPELSIAVFTVPVMMHAADAAPGEAGTGPVVGSAMLLLSLADSLFPLLGSDTVPTETGETVLVRRSGDEVVSINPLRHLPGSSRQLRIPFRTRDLSAAMALVGQAVVGKYTGYRGTAVVTATRFIPETGWGLVHKIDRDEAFAGFRATAQLEVLAAALLVIALAAAMHSQWQRQQAQLLAIQVAAARESVQLAAIVKSSVDAIISENLDGTITTWNPGAAALYGYSAAEAVGRSIEMLLPPERRDELEALLLRVGQGETVPRFDTVRIRKDGTRLDVSVIVSPLKNATGQVVGTSTIASDITQRKRAEETLRQTAEELARSNAELQQFAYTASHDLQEPLRMVTSYVELLARRYKGALDADADDFIGFAVDGAQRMQRLINDLLNYSRVGTRGGEPTPVDTEHLLGTVLTNLQETIAANSAVVTHDPLPTVLAEEVQLGQVLQNLIGNALKFRSEAPPCIHIAARRESGHWEFSVRDNGIGIDPHHFDRIFVIFQRLQGRDTFPGTGIGLAICKRIVERHGGRIWVESEPGNGATFFFTIPDKGEART